MSKQSTAIKSFEQTAEGLVIEFISGEKYIYPTATEAIVSGLNKAESKGRYFNEKIRPLDGKIIA